MVTDGEIPDPEKSLVEELDRVKEDMGLKARARKGPRARLGRRFVLQWGQAVTGVGCLPVSLLQVHALLVGAGTNDAIDALATNTHVFRSWCGKADLPPLCQDAQQRRQSRFVGTLTDVSPPSILFLCRRSAVKDVQKSR